MEGGWVEGGDRKGSGMGREGWSRRWEGRGGDGEVKGMREGWRLERDGRGVKKGKGELGGDV